MVWPSSPNWEGLMPYRANRSVWRDLLVGVLASLIAALLLTTCTGGPVRFQLDLRVGAEGADGVKTDEGAPR